MNQTFNLTLDEYTWQLLQEKLIGWNKEKIVRFAVEKLAKELQENYGVSPVELWQYNIKVFNESDESDNFASKSVKPLTFEDYA
jgi:hypothetical protein